MDVAELRNPTTDSRPGHTRAADPAGHPFLANRTESDRTARAAAVRRHDATQSRPKPGALSPEPTAMRQLLMNTNGVVVARMPRPIVQPGTVLIRSQYSLVGVGTEIAPLRSASVSA